MGIAQLKVEEAGLRDRTSFTVVADGDRISIGGVDCEFLPITHSVPQSLAVAFHTPQGVIVHTGDFKLDYTPVDNRLTDLSRLGALGSDPGVRLLMADSTNADAPGHSESETTVGETLRHLFAEFRGRRVIAACFASHLHRVQQIADVALDEGRTVFPVGRSMVNNVRLARELGVLDIADRSIRAIDDVNDFAPEKICIICTGSQGEPMAALALMSLGTHHDITIESGDAVVMSSHPIPGNEAPVFDVINRLVRRGADVVHSGQDHVHVTGHAKRDELRTLQSVVRPEYFVPIEGEYRMLVRHAELAVDIGLESDHAIVAVNGDQVVLDDKGVGIGGQVPHRYRYVDGIVDDVSQQLLDDRALLAHEGFVAISVTIDRKGHVVAGPHVESRGWVAPQVSDHLLADVERAVSEAVERVSGERRDDSQLRRIVRRAAGSTVAEITRRRPVIVPMILRSR
jgi:ribonuclease J